MFYCELGKIKWSNPAAHQTTPNHAPERKTMSERAKSIYAGRPLYDMSQMICSPAMRKAFARAKTSGYLSGAAKKPNRWGIERVDIDASTCLQSNPCQHGATFWMVGGGKKSAHTSCAGALYVVAQLIGVKFDAKGEAHLGKYAGRVATDKATVEADLDAHLLRTSATGTTGVATATTTTTTTPSATSSTATTAATTSTASAVAEAEKKRKPSERPVAAVPKRRLVETAMGWVEEESSSEEKKEK
jgi:hypothetical protein